MLRGNQPVPMLNSTPGNLIVRQQQKLSFKFIFISFAFLPNVNFQLHVIACQNDYIYIILFNMLLYI